MRCRLLLVVLATSTLVLAAFAIPLGLLVRTVGMGKQQADRDRIGRLRQRLQGVGERCLVERLHLAPYGLEVGAYSLRWLAEYFAIAVETLAFAPDVFCASYSAEEIAWAFRKTLEQAAAVPPSTTPVCMPV